jgi:hypothetical protein
MTTQAAMLRGANRGEKFGNSCQSDQTLSPFMTVRRIFGRIIGIVGGLAIAIVRVLQSIRAAQFLSYQSSTIFELPAQHNL